jgi:hypothetical protein
LFVIDNQKSYLLAFGTQAYVSISLMLQPRNFPRPTKQQVDLKQQKDVDLLRAQTLRKEGPAAVANDVDLWCGPILPASSHVRPSFEITLTVI